METLLGLVSVGVIVFLFGTILGLIISCREEEIKFGPVLTREELIELSREEWLEATEERGRY
jgi:hypothetical protein